MGARSCLFILSCFLLISGCGEDEAASTCIEEGEAEGGIIINVVCGDPRTQPLYFWDEDKKAFLIEVKRTSEDQALAWSALSNTQQNEITPRVQHGNKQTLPLGIIEDGNETELEIGVEYIVRVLRSSESGGLSESGSRKFTILPQMLIS